MTAGFERLREHPFFQQLIKPGSPTQTVYYVKDEDSCDPDKGGWHYDVEPSTGVPKRIVLCAKTCEDARKDESGRVDVDIGCDTITMPPK